MVKKKEKKVIKKVDSVPANHDWKVEQGEE